MKKLKNGDKFKLLNDSVIYVVKNYIRYNDELEYVPESNNKLLITSNMIDWKDTARLNLTEININTISARNEKYYLEYISNIIQISNINMEEKLIEINMAKNSIKNINKILKIYKFILTTE